MDVRIVGIPMIDSHPIQSRAKVGFHLLGEVAGEGLQVGHIAGVLRRDNEPEMVTVVLAAFGKRRAIGAVAAGIKHLGPLTTPGHAIALQIREMGRQRR
jgi:hypothetical protein